MSADTGTTLRLSVVIPCFRRRELLPGTVESVLAQSAPSGSYEILLVDNNSGDGTLDVARSLAAANPGRIRALSEPVPGAGHARNRGVRDARADTILFLDDDMLAHPTLVQEHLAAHARHRGSVLGFIETRWSDRSDLFLRYLHKSEVQNNFPFEDGAVVSHRYFYTGNVSVRREAFLAIGGFDPAFRIYGVEDIDLGYRLEMEGEPLLFVKAARSTHCYDPTHAEFTAKRVAAGRSLAYFLAKYPHLRASSGFERRAFLRLFPRAVVYSLARPFIFARNGNELTRWQWRYFGSTIRWRMYWSYRKAGFQIQRRRRANMAAYLR
jgi:glycosyltransferase involved in cell wall biosynthesis